MRFTDFREIIEMESILKAYLFEAIEVERMGLKVNFKKDPEPVPDQLQKKLDEDHALENAFNALTPGRRRGYILYFSQPVQAKTQLARIEKCIPKILKGEGLNDYHRSSKKK